MSLVSTHTPTENVLPVFWKDVEDWKELKAIDSFFVRFRKISPNEALSNALELQGLVKNLKDSVKPKIFETPSLDARINILNNETLRLADLITISAIKPNEVNTQIDKTMLAFSALNTKINAVLAKINFENDIDVDVKFIGLDSSRIDSVSKKSIDLRIKQKILDKNNLDNGSQKREQ